MESGVIYYGQQKCTTQSCKNKAYYINKEDDIKCGVHCRDPNRRTLPKLSMKEINKIKKENLENETKIIEIYAKQNRNNHLRGNVILSRLIMLKSPETVTGYLKVFPNFKHQNRHDGFGCASLSPMSLGPVDHGQPGLPPAINIENFHQGSKCFKQEVDENNNPTELFYKNRLGFYLDSVPHRHKYIGITKNKNIPFYFVWLDKNSIEHRLNYIESRQFYCNFYERLAKQTEDFAYLMKLLSNGVNLQICGYDAHPVDGIDDIEQYYLDPNLPFGHELVLYTMLMMDEKDYPWKKYKTFDF